MDNKIYAGITLSEKTGGLWFSMLFAGREYKFTISDYLDNNEKYGSIDRLVFSFSDNSDPGKSLKIKKTKSFTNPAF